MSTEVLIYRQPRWSEYLSVLDHVVRFCPQELGEKPDSPARFANSFKGVVETIRSQTGRVCTLRRNFPQRLRATRLQHIASCAASLVEDSSQILDYVVFIKHIKLGLQRTLLPLGIWPLLEGKARSPLLSIAFGYPINGRSHMRP